MAKLEPFDAARPDDTRKPTKVYVLVSYSAVSSTMYKTDVRVFATRAAANCFLRKQGMPIITDHYLLERTVISNKKAGK